MNYTITLIENLSKADLSKALKHTYDLPEPPAGSWSLQGVGTQTIVTFHRNIGDDEGILDTYGEPMDSATTVRQLHLELMTAIGSMDSTDSDEAQVINTLKSIASGLNRSSCAVAGVEEASMSYTMSTGLPMEGEEGMRVYVAIDTDQNVQLIRAKDKEGAKSLVDKQCDSIHFIGMLGGRY